VPGELPNGAPARVLHIREPAAGLDAVVVVDHTLFPLSAGGTRMAADVTDEEVARLARAMTWKFAVYRLPLAGAKAGIRWDGTGDRREVLDAYFEAIEPWRDRFLTGPDLGTLPEDFLDSDAQTAAEPPLWAQTFDGADMDGLATGHGVRAAAEVALGRLGRSLAGATVAIEGFGKVGAGAARSFARAGARIVAVSTVAGTLADPVGLDVDELLRLRERHGDDLVAHGSVPALSREALLTSPCDVLVPGARPDAVTPELVPSLRCHVVAPAANIPYADGACAALHERGILALPDFVANAGGVFLYESADRGEDPATCLASVEEVIGAATRRVLDAAGEGGLTPMAAALELAREFLAESLEGRGEPRPSL